MYKSLTYITSGELTGTFGVKSSLPADLIRLSTYDKLDDIHVLSTQLKIQYLMDLIDSVEIGFSELESDEINMLSVISYTNSGIVGIGNAGKATAKRRVDNGSLRFVNPNDGHLTTLHTMLRLCFMKYPPNETILSNIHLSFTNLLYTIIIRMFDKAFGISNLTEKYFAAVRYACACIVAKKHFILDVPINDAAIPLTTMTYTRISPDVYKTDNNITTYENLVIYLNEFGIVKDLDKGTFINTILRHLGYRILIDLDCGLDLLIDIILCKAAAGSNILPGNLYKVIGFTQYEVFQKKINQLYTSTIKQ